MSDQIFKMKRGDTSPSIQYDITSSGANLVDALVVFNLVKADGEPVLTRVPALAVINGAQTLLQYDWPAGLEDSGKYIGEFEVTYGDNSVETFPNEDYIVVVVQRDLG